MSQKQAKNKRRKDTFDISSDKKESNPKLVRFLKYGITSLVLCGLAGLIFYFVYSNPRSGWVEEVTIFGSLCDAFCFTGIISICAFGFTWLSSQGAFDLIVFGVKKAFYTIFYSKDPVRARDLPATYADYANEKREKDRVM